MKVPSETDPFLQVLWVPRSLDHDLWSGSIDLSISRKSLDVSSTATAPMFSSRRSCIRVPGIGSICSSGRPHHSEYSLWTAVTRWAACAWRIVCTLASTCWPYLPESDPSLPLRRVRSAPADRHGIDRTDLWHRSLVDWARPQHSAWYTWDYCPQPVARWCRSSSQTWWLSLLVHGMEQGFSHDPFIRERTIDLGCVKKCDGAFDCFPY